MTGRLALLLACAAALSGAGRASAQGCARVPRADAGADVQQCIAAVGTSDYVLTASRSLSQPLNGPIVEYCWTTDFGTFTATGTGTACLPGTDVTLRVPNTPGRTLVTATLRVTDASGCSDDDQVVLDLATAPVITRAQASSATACLGQPLDLLASVVNTFEVNGLVTYRWDTDTSIDVDRNGVPDDDGDAVLTGVSGRLVVATFTPPRAGRYVARLTASSAGNPCTAVVDVPYEMLSAPVVRLIAGPATACPNQIGVFQAELAFGATATDLTWDFDTSVDSDLNGSASDDVEALGQQVQHSWPEGGNYTVRVTAVGTNDCEGFEDRQVLIRDAPVAAFTATGAGCGPAVMTFVDGSSGAAPLTIGWTFGDGSPAESGPQRTHVFPGPGTYSVSHFVTDSFGCTTSQARPVRVEATSARIEGVTLLDGQAGTGTSGNGNGFAEPGESVRLVVDVRNASSATAAGWTVRLSSREPDGLFAVTDASATLGAIAPGATGTTQDPHLAAVISELAPCGSALPVDVVAGPDGSACATTATLSLRVGIPGLRRQGDEVPVASSAGVSTAQDADFALGSHLVALLDRTAAVPRARIVRVSATGQRIGDVLVDDLASQVSQVRVALDEESGQGAAAWIGVESASGQGGRAVRWRRLDAAGQPAGTSRRIDLLGTPGTLDLAWAGDHWVVAYTDRAPSSPAPRLYLQVVTPDGLLLGSPLALSGDLPEDGDVRVAALAGRALIAHRNGDEMDLYHVEGLRPAAVVRSETLPDADGMPSVDRFGAGFVLAFESDGAIDVAWITASGATQRSTLVSSGTRPAVAGSRDEALLAWQSGADVFAATLGASGRAAGSPLLVTPGPDPASGPVVSGPAGGLFLETHAVAGSSGTLTARGALLAPALPDDCDPAAGLAGDVDGSGAVDIGDVVLVLRASVGLTAVTPAQLAAGDVAPGTRTGNVHLIEGNGALDVADAVVLLQVSTGLITLDR